jgi:exosortase/archaeosortase family protein
MLRLYVHPARTQFRRPTIYCSTNRLLSARGNNSESGLVRRALIFLVVFGTLQLAWQMMDDSRLHHLVIDRGIVEPTAVIGRLLTPGFGIHALDNRLRTGGNGINVVNGCDGMETLFLLLAAFTVAPLPLRARAQGVLIGIPLVYGLNVARLLALLYAHRVDMGLFDFMHGVITPILMVVSIAAFYYAWLRRSQRIQVL